jgi:hypothetical protein
MHFPGDVELFSYDDLRAIIQGTYTIWSEVLANRDQSCGEALSCVDLSFKAKATVSCFPRCSVCALLNAVGSRQACWSGLKVNRS